MYGIAGNVMYMILIYATCDKAVKVQFANVIYFIHIDRLQVEFYWL